MNGPETLHKAMQLHQAGRLSEAQGLYTQFLSSNPDHPDGLHLLGLLHSQLGNQPLAIDLIQKSIAIKPNYFEAHTNLANALRATGQLAAAIASYRTALSLSPSDPEAIYNLGCALLDAGDSDSAIAHLQRALQINPGFALAHTNLANALRNKDALDQALAHHQRALALDPHNAQVHNNLAALLDDLGRFDRALAHYTTAATLAPDFPQARWNRACALLLHGQYGEGFREYESRWQQPNFPSPPRNFAQPQWTGESLATQTLLVHTEQGLGDAVQFARYLPLVAERAPNIILESPPELLSLFQSSFPDVTHVLRGQPLPRFDMHIPLLTLPLIFQTTLQSIPSQVPYLRPEARLVGEWKSRVASDVNFKVGLIYSGRAIPDPNRSIDPALLSPLAQLPNITFYSLQRRDPEVALKPLPFSTVDFTSQLTDMAQTAALMMNLDLIITIDSGPAHLAGALGRPTWTLVPFRPDWRWLIGREDSPWYPTMKLFRQPQRGDWGSVIVRVIYELKNFRRAAPAAPAPSA